MKIVEHQEGTIYEIETLYGNIKIAINKKGELQWINIIKCKGKQTGFKILSSIYLLEGHQSECITSLLEIYKHSPEEFFKIFKKLSKNEKSGYELFKVIAEKRIATLKEEKQNIEKELELINKNLE